jgi:hypothetical protein
MNVWVEEKASKGLPAKETQQLFLELRDKYQKQISAKGYPWES